MPSVSSLSYTITTLSLNFILNPMPLCRYLAVVKRRGHAIDPVAHFHLQNGASIWRLNWRADISSKGMERSYGLMVNYHYNLLDISQNSDAYSISGTIAQSDSFSHWLK